MPGEYPSCTPQTLVYARLREQDRTEVAWRVRLTDALNDLHMREQEEKNRVVKQLRGHLTESEAGPGGPEGTSGFRKLWPAPSAYRDRTV